MRAPRMWANGWLAAVGVGGTALALSLPAQAEITAVDDAYSTEAATTLTVDEDDGVLANDTGGDDDLRAVLVAGPANGALVLDAEGGFVYQPNVGFAGSDSFTYHVGDEDTTSNVATVTIAVTAAAPRNTAPTAADDSYSATEGAVLDVDAANGVLANDTDEEPGPLTAVLVDGPDDGALTLSPNGSFRYTPEDDFRGRDEFRYRARDATGATSKTATVTIEVGAVNEAPVAVADSYRTNEGQTLNVNARNGVLDNDTDADRDKLTAFLVTDASSGALTLQGNGAFSFVPAAGFAGTVTFAYEAGDGTLRSSPATVTIVVDAVNRPPTARADSYSTAEDTVLSVSAAPGVLANDSDPDGGALTAALVRTVTDGALTLRPDGSFTYAPGANFSGSTTFTYQARDGSASSAAVTVTLTVTAVNDAPFVSNSPPRTASEGVTYRYTLAASDPDGDALTVTAPTLPSWLRFAPPATVWDPLESTCRHASLSIL